jgi:hypothetical protein
MRRKLVEDRVQDTTANLGWWFLVTDPDGSITSSAPLAMAAWRA